MPALAWKRCLRHPRGEVQTCEENEEEGARRENAGSSSCTSRSQFVSSIFVTSPKTPAGSAKYRRPSTILSFVNSSAPWMFSRLPFMMSPSRNCPHFSISRRFSVSSKSARSPIIAEPQLCFLNY